ncbi:hypothetical protein BGZ51_004611 [Haplosporangium sp. Z 767]|nr:hypothetical protein BGZ51_004611 [Haplosporangium sp. Z 767]KAF9195526.1 hypothetical protein BGZ50_004326 [Haplosporangium sp. Z 11]
MAHRLLNPTPFLNRTTQTLTARARAAIPAQYANYVTASAVVMAGGKAKKGSPKVKQQSNSFRKKKTEDEDKIEGGSGGAARLNDKYYKPPTPVRVEEFLPSTATKEHVGQVLGFPSTVVPALSQVAYPTLLNDQFDLIKPPALVVRESTVSLLEKIDQSMKTPSAQTRIVLSGPTGAGKSAMLLQTVSHCLSAGWIVIYVPKASTWVNSSFAYNKVANSTSFVQPQLASNLIGQIISVNKPVLCKIVMAENATVGRHEVEQGTTLSALLEYGIKDPFAAQGIMEVFMKEIGAQNEVPILVAVDEVNNLFRPTQYLSQDAKELDPEHLKLPELFLNYISGKRSFNHGAIVAATSDALLAKKSEVLDVALGVKEVSPYKSLSQTIMPWTQGLTRFEVPNYTRQEAKGVFDYYKKGNVFYDAPSESFFLNKFITSNGNPQMTAGKQITNTRVLISKIPEGVAPSKNHFRSETVTVDAPVLKKNEILVKNLIFSLDPYIRHEFPEGKDEAVVIGFAIAKVVDSNNEKFPVGALVFAASTWETYTHVYDPLYLNDVGLLSGVVDPAVPLPAYNGVLGVPGFTVWDSLNKIGDLKKSETIYISSAAGTLGQLAGQLAKRKGLRVIGSAGSDEKVAFLKNELGFDGAFNYKTQDRREALTELIGEAGLDIYYDLVGDDTTEIVLDLLNPHGRVLAVGILASHQNAEPYAPKNLINILFKQLRYEGYLVFERYEHMGRFWEEVTPLVAKGEIKYTDTVLKQDIESLGETYVKFLSGAFKGKVNVQVADV